MQRVHASKGKLIRDRFYICKLYSRRSLVCSKISSQSISMGLSNIVFFGFSISTTMEIIVGVISLEVYKGYSYTETSDRINSSSTFDSIVIHII